MGTGDLAKSSQEGVGSESVTKWGKNPLIQYQFDVNKQALLYSGAGNTEDNFSGNVFHLTNKPFNILFLLNHCYVHSFAFYAYYARS